MKGFLLVLLGFVVGALVGGFAVASWKAEQFIAAALSPDESNGTLLDSLPRALDLQGRNRERADEFMGKLEDQLRSLRAQLKPDAVVEPAPVVRPTPFPTANIPSSLGGKAKLDQVYEEVVGGRR